MLRIATDDAFAGHDPGPGHPERIARLRAVDEGVHAAGVDDALEPLEPRDATLDELARVHHRDHLELLERASARAGPRGVALDPDTVVSRGSWVAATRAAGAGLAAIDALARGAGDAAFLAVRPPGHHAGPARSMGFCLVNSVAVTAATLAEQGERVCIVDYDAHHGNGTQDVFVGDPRVLYVSFHQWPLYPGTGRADEVGTGAAAGTTCNVPLPAGATGDCYLRAWDDVIGSLVERFRPDWMLVSAGFDAHRDDPLAGLGLSAGDFAVLTGRLVAAVRPGRTVVFLEGGYDLVAVRNSVAAVLPVLLGQAGTPAEAATSGGPGSAAVERVRAVWAERLE